MGCKCYGAKENGELLHNVYSEEKNDVKAYIMHELLQRVDQITRNYSCKDVISINLDMRNFKIEYEVYSNIAPEPRHAVCKYEIVEFEEK